MTRAILHALAVALLLAAPAGATDIPGPAAVPPPAVEVREGALSGPIDPDVYMVGPGDLFTVTIRAGEVVSLAAAVTPEGNLVLPGIAVVPVAGLSLTGARAAALSRIGEQYREAAVSIALTGLRRIEVHVLGAVANPGPRIGTALDRAGRLVNAAGGVLDGGSRRNIRITRPGGEERRVDLARYEALGDLDVNPPILDGDVILVPFAKGQVSIHGSVEEPNAYEFVPGETVEGLVGLAGGVSREVRADSIEVRSFLDGTRTRSELLPWAQGFARTLSEGDQVYIRFRPDWHETRNVELEGEFLSPGLYGINEGTDLLSDVLRRSGGFTPEASLHDATVVRIARSDIVDAEYERLKQVPIEEMTELEYAYFKTKSRQRPGLLVVDMEQLLAGDKGEDILLRDGDRVAIPRKTETIEVAGQVARPGRVTWVKSKPLAWYVNRAGGYSSSARRSRIRVIRGATGEWVPSRKAGELLPGDVIWVPEKPERDWWKTAQETVRFAASVATVYLVIHQATGN
ncbi:MAG: SLBB domain-containing protein [Gemmatimonadota bacterium]|jgi:protein involved in polysaccharide export with SLBB domain|nr:SLBB domain-containing protein [Gemmatimonadota bacterium]